MESGKTTLTAGLVRSGWSYLTDEAVAFDWDTGRSRPFPKPLSVDPGSQHLFPELARRRRPPPRPMASSNGRFPPSMFRPDAVGERCRAGFASFPFTAADAPDGLLFGADHRALSKAWSSWPGTPSSSTSNRSGSRSAR
jgi:hypothetical protein